MTDATPGRMLVTPALAATRARNAIDILRQDVCPQDCSGRLVVAIASNQNPFEVTPPGNVG